MKQNNRQTLPLGRSTKADNAGLSLLRPRLFEVIGDTYNYFNEIIQNTFKSISPFLKRLTQKKFSHASITVFDKVINFKIDFHLKRPFCLPSTQYYWFNKNLRRWNH